MDGSTAVGLRARLVDDFNSNAEVFVFLLTTKVGGLGINLTGADRCSLHDPSSAQHPIPTVWHASVWQSDSVVAGCIRV